MTLADLPPSSSVTRLMVLAAPSITRCPTSVEPVKPILATSGCAISRSPSVAGRLAGVGGLQPRERLAVLLHERRGAAQQADAIGRLHGTPRGKCSFGRRDSAIRLGRARAIQVRYRLLGRRIDHVEGRGG